MTDLLLAEIAKGEILVQAVIGLMGLVMIVAVWARTKSFVPTLGAVLFGAIVNWAVLNSDFLEAKVNEEFQSLPVVTANASVPRA